MLLDVFVGEFEIVTDASFRVNIISETQRRRANRDLKLQAGEPCQLLRLRSLFAEDFGHPWNFGY